MSLLDEVAGLLTGRGIDVALIGAAALAAHGVSRATADLDLLVVDLAALDHEIWSGLRAAGDEVEIRRGDEADPLAGVVRVAREGNASVDVIVGKAAGSGISFVGHRPLAWGIRSSPSSRRLTSRS